MTGPTAERAENRGCDPRSVGGGRDVVDWARRMSGHGVRSSDLHIDGRCVARLPSARVAQHQSAIDVKI